MKTLYIEKNSHDIKIFRQENSSFQLLQEFSSARQEEYADFLKGLSPEQTYISMENSDFGFWNNIHKSHNPLAWVEKTKTQNSCMYQFDVRLEKLLSALALPKITERNFHEGITLLVENNYNFFAVLAYKNEIYAAFEHDITKLTPQTLQKNLEEFRFGWLPHEEVIKQNGSGCIIKDIPAEAEGFRPTFIACEHEECFNRFGRMISIENTKETMVQLLRAI